MFGLQRTSEERTGDSSRPFMYNRTPEHEDRIIDHCAQVQREFLDTEPGKADMKIPNVTGLGRLQVRAFNAVFKMLPHFTPEKRLAIAMVTTSNDAFARADKAKIRQWELEYG